MLATYANSLHGPFFVDDLPAIVDNESIHDWHHLDLFARQETPLTSRPLVAASLALNYALGAADVRGYHLVNVVVHLGAVLLLFGATRTILEWPRLRGRVGSRAPAIAFAVAALWAVHPLNTEAVDYVTQRTESLMGFFYVATVYASARVMRQPGRGWTTIAVACCAAGMACKESMVTAPVAILLMDRAFVSDSVADAMRTRWRLYAGLAATWLLLAALAALAPPVRSAGFATTGSSWNYLLNQTVMIVRYLRLTLWPTSLVVNYGWPVALHLREVWPETLLVAGLFTATVWALWKHSLVGFAGAWFFLTLAPTSSVMPIVTEVGAERRMYVPLMGLIAGAVVATVMGWDVVAARAGRVEHRAKIVGWTTLAALIVALAVGTMVRNSEYRSALTLAQTTVERWPSSVGEHVLGAEWLLAGNKLEAFRHFQRAVPAAPRAYYSLATLEFDRGQWDAAIGDFRAFLEAQPLLFEAISARLYLAQALGRTGDWQAVIDQCRLVLAMHPPREDALDAQLFLADGLRGQQRYDVALGQYEAYVRARPSDARGAYGLAMSFGGLNRRSEAASWFRRAADLTPTDSATQRNAAMALLEAGRVDDAAPYAERAVSLRPDDAASHDLWGQILFDQHKTEAALEQFEAALHLNPAASDIRIHLDQVRKWASRRQ